jgi:hypothetical protein
LDNLGQDWTIRDKAGISPAEHAAEYGRLDVLQWLWTKGALLAEPRVGWSDRVPDWRGPEWELADPSIIVAAARGGHVAVIAFLTGEVGIPLGRSHMGLTALHAACEGGHVIAAEALLKAGGRLHAVRRRSLWTDGNGVRSLAEATMTALGGAIASGALRCALVLLRLCKSDGSSPSAVTLAALSGHADVLRAVLVKWPEENCDEAFSIALVKRDGASEGVIGPRSFVWTPLVIRLLQRLPAREMGRVCASYDLTENAVKSEEWYRGNGGGAPFSSRPMYGAYIWSGVRAMLLRGSATRDVVEAAARRWHGTVLGAKWRRDTEFWSLVRGLRLRPESIRRPWPCSVRWNAGRVKEEEFLMLAGAHGSGEGCMWDGQ